MKEDYLILEIRKIGILMLGLLEKLFKIKNGNEQILDETTQLLSEKLQLNLENLSALTDDGFIQQLIANKVLNTENLELLADLLSQIGDMTSDKNKKNVFYAKSLAIYNWLEHSTLVFSIERQEKMKKIKEILF